MKDTIAILVNPHAKKQKVDFILKEMAAALGNDIPFAVFIADWPGDVNAYCEVWLVGGDGTLNFFLNRYTSISIPIVIFKGGTGNDFATRLYGKMDTAQQVQAVLRMEPRPVDAGRCNGRLFINGVGIGFDGEVLRSMRSIRLLGGHLGYLWIVIRKIFSFKEGNFRLRYDDRDIEGRFLLVMITNSSQTGGGFMVSPEAKIDDGKLNVVLCRPQPVLKRLQYLPLIEKGKHLNRDFIIHREAGHVKVDCEKETPAQIDGELIHANTYDIDVLPAQFLFKY